MLDLSSLRQGDHACAVYDSPEDQLPSLAQYIKEGIDAGERCVYIVDDRTAADVLAALHAAGVDVGSARDTGRLQLLTKRESYLKDGSFNPDQMIFLLAAMTDQALADSCTGLRITGEMTWALGTETGCDRIIEYEAKLNQFFPVSRAHAICQYNRPRFPAPIIREVLRHHPIVAVGEDVCENPYFEPPEVLGLPDGHSRRVEHMLDQLVHGARSGRFSHDLS